LKRKPKRRVGRTQAFEIFFMRSEYHRRELCPLNASYLRRKISMSIQKYCRNRRGYRLLVSPFVIKASSTTGSSLHARLVTLQHPKMALVTLAKTSRTFRYSTRASRPELDAQTNPTRIGRHQKVQSQRRPLLQEKQALRPL